MRQPGGQRLPGRQREVFEVTAVQPDERAVQRQLAPGELVALILRHLRALGQSHTQQAVGLQGEEGVGEPLELERLGVTVGQAGP